MGLLDFFRRGVELSPDVAPNGVTAEYEWLGDNAWHGMLQAVSEMSPEDMYRTQPMLRTVVSFLARNVAQLGLHTFERRSDTDRARVQDSVAARLFSRPNDTKTRYEFIADLVSDLCLYDEAFVWIEHTSTGAKAHVLSPMWLVDRDKGGLLTGPKNYKFSANGGRERIIVPADEMVHFHGYSPGVLHKGVSPVIALRQLLKEQASAYNFREQLWARSGRLGGVIERPLGQDHKPLTWSPEAQKRFMESWSAAYSGNGPGSGGTPVLDEGMTFRPVKFTAHEEQFVEAATLALKTVAGVYHVDPLMIGGGDASYAASKEARKRLYTDTLGPLLEMIQDRINTFMLPMLGEPEGHYVEFNIEEKMKGDFESQAAALQSSTGAPWMTVNEARALRNLPAMEGGDDLIVPMNVSQGGQASPTDSGSQNVNPFAESHDDEPKARSVLIKGRASMAREQQAADIFRKNFDRQERAVLPRLKAKSFADWWDADRWNRELATDLERFSHEVVTEVATDTLAKAGYSPASYSAGRVASFLKAVTDSRAKWVNNGTYDAIQAIIDAGNPDVTADHAFAVAKDSRAESSAKTLTTTLSNIATVEAAKQSPAEHPMKVWVLGESDDHRAKHVEWAGMKAELDSEFENGAQWPGDPVLGAQDTVNCSCEIDIEWS